ncbi:MAG: hypothetical protein MK066_14195, partial [Crocinitomicaceae bacterium]|nr:hypothetical protein [Crocinitomicaceae bacterium]
MNLIVIMTLLIVGISALVMRLRDVSEYGYIINVLFLAVLTSVSISLDRSEEVVPIYGLLGVTVLNLLVAQWKQLRKAYFRIIFPLLSLIVFFLVFSDDVVQLLGEKNVVIHKFTILGGILSVLLYEFAFFKSNLLQKIRLTELNTESTRILEFLFLGIALLFGSLGSGVFGVLVIVSGYMAAACYRSDDSDVAISSSLIAIIGLYILNFHSSGVSIDLLKGDVLMGLLV